MSSCFLKKCCCVLLILVVCISDACFGTQRVAIQEIEDPKSASGACHCKCGSSYDICEYLKIRYATNSDLSKLKTDIENVKHDVQSLSHSFSGVEKISVLSELRNALDSPEFMNMTAFNNLTRELEELRNECQWFKNQLEEQKRSRRSLEDHLYYLEEGLNKTQILTNNVSAIYAKMEEMEETLIPMQHIAQKDKNTMHKLAKIIIETAGIKFIEVITDGSRNETKDPNIYLYVTEDNNNSSEKVSGNTIYANQEEQNVKILKLEEQIKRLQENHRNLKEELQLLKQSKKDSELNFSSYITTSEMLFKDLRKNVLWMNATITEMKENVSNNAVMSLRVDAFDEKFALFENMLVELRRMTEEMIRNETALTYKKLNLSFESMKNQSNDMNAYMKKTYKEVMQIKDMYENVVLSNISKLHEATEDIPAMIEDRFTKTLSNIKNTITEMERRQSETDSIVKNVTEEFDSKAMKYLSSQVDHILSILNNKTALLSILGQIDQPDNTSQEVDNSTSTSSSLVMLPSCSLEIYDPHVVVTNGEDFVTNFAKERNYRKLEDVPSGSKLYFFCQPFGMYQLEGEKTLLCDENGIWTASHVPTCKKLKNETDLQASEKDKIDTACPKPNGQFPHPEDCHKYYNCWKGTATEQRCAGQLYFDPSIPGCNYQSDVDCDSGKRPGFNFGSDLSAVTPAIIFEPSPEINGSRVSLNPKGKLLVKTGITLNMHCLYPKSRGIPEWEFSPVSNINSPYWFPKKYAKDSKEQIFRYVLSISVAKASHSGNYTCKTPHGGMHTVEIIVKDKLLDHQTISSKDGNSRLEKMNSRTKCSRPDISGVKGLAFTPDLAEYNPKQPILFHCKDGRTLEGVTMTRCMDDGSWTLRDIPKSLPRCV